MDAYELSDLIAQQKGSGKLYLEFLKVLSLSMGVYRLSAGATDTQKPHTEDEIYYVTHGKAVIHVGGEDRAVTVGSVIYVAANAVHYFHDITEDLTLLVFFAPPEYANAYPLKG